MIDYTTRYAMDVTAGKILAGQYVKQACQRHLADIKKSKNKNYPYKFDTALVDKWYTLFDMLRLWKGNWAGQVFKLEPWQRFILGNIVGWVNKKSGLRKYKKVYIEVARKNAKTTLLAGIAIGMLAIDGEIGGQVYAAATKEAQARIVVNDVAKILRQSPDVWTDPDDGSANFQCFELRGEAHRVICNLTNSFMTALGRDSKTQDGLDISCGIIDEYHAHTTDDMKQVIESGMMARAQPLLLIITTAGMVKDGPCFLYRKMITEILAGHKQDDQTFGIIYTLDEGDDWQNPKVWIKSNPNLGVSVYEANLLAELTDALNQPSKQPAFITKNLNVWVDAPDVWIADATWQACASYMGIDELSGECWVGMDLASTGDITALMLYFPEHNYYKPLFFCPAATAPMREKNDGVPYRQWAKDGWLILTDGGGGKTTDYNYIKTTLLKLADQVDLKCVAYDRWNSSQIVIDLGNEGIRMEPYSQSLSHMSYPTKEFEKQIIGANMKHDGSPVMSWMMRNISLMHDSNDNIKIDKKRSSEKVDGPVAAVMALGQHLKDSAETETALWAV